MHRLVGVDFHGPELQRSELLHIRAESRLTEEHRTGRVQADPQCYVGEQRRECDERQPGHRYVDRALEPAGNRRGVIGRQSQQRKPFN